MCEPASYDLGNRIRAPDTVPWVNWYSDVSGAEGGFWTAYGGHPCQRDAISCPSGSQSVCLSVCLVRATTFRELRLGLRLLIFSSPMDAPVSS